MTQAEWYDAARDAGIGAKRAADLTDNRMALRRKKLVHCCNDRWYVTNV